MLATIHVTYVLVSCALYSPYDVDASVQLVCKYLRAYKYRADKKQGINKLYVDNGKFSITLYKVCV